MKIFQAFKWDAAIGRVAARTVLTATNIKVAVARTKATTTSARMIGA